MQRDTTRRPRGRTAAAAAAAMLTPLVAALAGCGGGTRTVTQSGAPTTAAPALSPPAGTAQSATGTTAAGAGEAPTRFVSLTTFRSPSGNIGCAIAGGVARCDIVQRSWQPPPRPHTCPQVVDFGQGLEVGTRGAGRLVCAGDTARDPTSTRLAYGTATRAEGFTCVSRRTGMTCTDVGGHGFQLSRQGYRAF